MERFGVVVKRVRLEKGWTLEQVAKKLGTHKGYVSGIETGKVNPPSAKLVRRYARTLGRDEKDLLRRAHTEKAPKAVRRDFEMALFPAEERGSPPQRIDRVEGQPSEDVVQVVQGVNSVADSSGSPATSEIGGQ